MLILALDLLHLVLILALDLLHLVLILAVLNVAGAVLVWAVVSLLEWFGVM